MIADIKNHNDYFDCGKLYSTLFCRNINVYIAKEVNMEYAEQCAEHFSALNDEMTDKLCERTSAFHQYMLEEWNEDLVKIINMHVPPTVTGRDILRYIKMPSLYVLPPRGDGIGYIVEGLCEWEPEHGIAIIIRDNEVLYVGTPESYDPWSDNEFICDY